MVYFSYLPCYVQRYYRCANLIISPSDVIWPFLMLLMDPGGYNIVTANK